MCKFICVAKCPELDWNGEAHCETDNPEKYEELIYGCPAGNIPKWEKIGEQQ